MLIRNFLFYLGLIPVTALFAILGLLFFFIPYQARYYLITRWSHFFIFWAKFIGGIDYQVKGLENLPPKNAIVLCNHQSMWETVFMQVLLPPQTWILKKSLLNIPFFGLGLRLLEPIALDRQDRESALKQINAQGQQYLQMGRWIVIFPEGTRVAPGVRHRFSKSGARLAIATGYPIVPIAHNAGVFWPRGFWIKKTGTIEVIIGPMIDSQGRNLQDIHESAEQWIRQMMQQLN